jgi:hypothetical protein
MTNIIVTEKWYSVQECLDNPKNIYIFGDNTKQYGKGGQAQIRDCPNSYGIPTKRLPTMSDDAFFNDDELMDTYLLAQSISLLEDRIKKDKYDDYNYIFPKDGLGTGLAQLKLKAPGINKLLAYVLEEKFNILTLEDGSLKIKGK